MGSNWSSLEQEPAPDPWWPASQPSNTAHLDVGKEEASEASSQVRRGRVRQEEIEQFEQELAQKRALRHEALSALQTELRSLRSKVEEERNQRIQAEQERDQLRSASTYSLQQELEKEKEEKKKLLDSIEKMKIEGEEKSALERQVQALKDVSEIGKEMLRIRELQVKELKKKLVEINISSVMAPPEDLRVEYEKQIENIRKLRTLYEERAAATLLEHRRELEREEAKIQVLEAKLSELQKEAEECKEAKMELEGKIENLENKIQNKEDELETTKDKLFTVTVQKNSLNSQLSLINNLFSQMLVSPQVDLDRLTRLLKENHGLITDLTEKGDSNEVAALLVDLAGQVEKENEVNQNSENYSVSLDESEETQSEIASNLSKVWRVMVELLSHHQHSGSTEQSGGAESCYKSIQTPSGPRSVISVSQTFLTLKDLILEKNRLVKEVGRLKTLNNHLEYRLGSQEKRLSVVTTELRKTWGVVNKLRAQHKQLHTHEKILRYELQQKRCMLTELKQELDHCRDKWDRARQKNSQTEEDWKKLRKEFAARKSRKESNSAESGYEEEDIAHSPPSEPVSSGDHLFELRPNEESETELSEEDMANSDGNSFDTVIDLLDIACLENPTEGECEIPFVLCEIPTQASGISSNLLPLSGSEFTEGLDQIESEDLAAVLDVQYQNQLLGADYNLSLPSSSGSSPIPTENDDFASSEMDASEEDSSLNDNRIYSSPLPKSNKIVAEDNLLFGSNSSKNISKFLEGLFADQPSHDNTSIKNQQLTLNIASTSKKDENNSTTPLANYENCYQFPPGSATPLVSSDGCYSFSLGSQEETVNNDNIKPIRVGQEDQSDSCFSTDDGLKTEKNTVQVTNQVDENPSHNCCSVEPQIKTQEELLTAREEKLKKLEYQCRSLVTKVMSTSFRSEVISNKLDELHLCYGSSEEPSDVEEETVSIENEIKEPNSPSSNENISSNVTTSFEPQNHKSVSESTPQVSLCQNSGAIKRKSPEEILEARAARLKRLEEQCKSLFSKMSATSSRSDIIANKLDKLHESFGPSDTNKFPEQPSTSKATSSLSKQSSFENLEKIKTNTNEPEFVLNEGKHSKPSDLMNESKEILNKCSSQVPPEETTVIPVVDSKKDRSPEEILEARAERFKRLEEQCKSLVSKMTATSLRSEIISNKLDELHSCYGSSEDTSDIDDHSSISTEENQRRSTPISSPRYLRKIHHDTAVKVNQADVTEGQTDVIIERISLTQIQHEPSTQADSSEESKRSSEEILQARAQRLDRLEEQCKSLFSKMSATSERSDVISNRLVELHEQYGQSSTSEDLRNCQTSTNQTTQVSNQTNVDILRHNERSPLSIDESPTSSESSSNQKQNDDHND